MRMRFMGPCRSSIYVAPEIVMGANEAYMEGWESFRETHARKLDNCVDAAQRSFPHARSEVTSRPVQYESVTTDTSFLPAYFFQGRLKFSAGQVDEIRAMADERLSERRLNLPEGFEKTGFCDTGIAAFARLYYGGVMIVWFDLPLDAGNLPAPLETIERLGIAWLQALAQWADEKLTDGLSDSPISANGTSRFFGVFSNSDQSARTVSWERSLRGKALWVTRSLITEARDDDSSGEGERTVLGDSGSGVDDPIEGMLSAWLKPVSKADDLAPLGKEGYSMRWLRYAFSQPALSSGPVSFEDAWESMLFCQFFWATLERIESQMFRVLGRIDSASDPSDVRRSYTELNTLREAAELTLVHHRHQMRYLARIRHRLVEQVLKGWQFDGLVENLREVITIARTRHETLLQKAAARGDTITDILLFAIGSFAVLDFFISLPVIGRQLASDTAIGRRDEGQFGILGAFSDWGVNDVLSFALLGVVIALLLIIRYRRRRPY
ncbi:MAG: hypothetical protein GY798_08420 [Hyphomicrobiales bacterium]|nr:hypothetical protein [Hyphomicrobiales bacterium]